MEIIHITKENLATAIFQQPVAAAFGFFDGLHLGHKALIDATKTYAEENGVKSAVITFDPSPSLVLKKFSDRREITPMNEKQRLLEQWNIDVLFIIDFNEHVAAIDHEVFLEQLIASIDLVHLVVGFDFHYGHKGAGDVHSLQEYSKTHNQFSLTVIDEQNFNGEKISSSAIRDAITDGQMEAVVPLLGRSYCISGVVVHGFKRGRTIGFPTANIPLDSYVMPKFGVYVTHFYIDDKIYRGITNVGLTPTFAEDIPALTETFIFDFNDEIYDKLATVEFLHYIRPELKFDSVDELIDRMNDDAEYARKYFAK
ncbi:bifunctional riboflavin kinase/FAD synthetase [Culicoidibacter larvae]|uniref:Riboflavin biosynthesis protein n=1 Tax=Culicoidibacter larvae TaxID=2579976 RepID=A0A5R8QA00_9FIRM|nr:bifunctional riboflavin kinase/FAD synthetase [Culicoidibacter larvae]TLG71792.1 bifunctional riboflavin kinase/FAD synthetase [Culicoidibacter larvae]